MIGEDDDDDDDGQSSKVVVVRRNICSTINNSKTILHNSSVHQLYSRYYNVYFFNIVSKISIATLKTRLYARCLA